MSFLWVVFGLIGTIGSADRWFPRFNLVLLGIVGIVVPLLILLNPYDNDVRRERDHGAAYLAKVLRPEATLRLRHAYAGTGAGLGAVMLASNML